ncbi:FmdB family zinc ribbon protein [Legionella maioricensis]|uniref:Zinc ribbon domain-containing protein n=1 Tax=Legionella maioricensis TaxID=2896528 RepID=A0A9X2D0R4_9GAMM|nr:zinc ribbon domain-containing protein [Legionella maioricensis]MCL9684301.1 zinc ribbon domain-containing protein [Legionella maioricensis]MCL9687167.1 zinc ribbon domain-containing protein [Legionella maioricensis]
MPIYEYECTSCHHHFDLIQKVTAEPVKQCPVCFNNSVVKLVSAAGFQLKGTGWYATDFKTKGTAPKDASGKKEDSGKTSNATAKDNPAATGTAKSTKGDSE